MLRRLQSLLSYTLRATDGSLGGVKDLYFDDSKWVIRYLVAETESWLPGRLALIATEALGQPDDEEKEFLVNLTVEKIRKSPTLETDKPVSRQKEEALRAYFQWPAYWDLAGAAVARKLKPVMPEMADALESAEDGDPHLQSVNEVLGYGIQATDGELGHVKDFVIDDEHWNVRYMVVDTRKWLPGKTVLVDPHWIGDISWSNQTASVALSQAQIKSSPEFDSTLPIHRKYEEQLYDHYGRPKYWSK
ncbi:PRC-barrel domain-containing protein [Candidatus Nitrospira salsa]